MDLYNFNLNEYIKNIDQKGLKSTWNEILNFLLENKSSSKLLSLSNLGDLYEVGLAHINKIEKKEMGKYYTPEDVAKVLAKWLIPFKNKNICDVGCGTGNLIISYLDLLDRDEVLKLLEGKNIYLYDEDPLALKICKYSIAIKYGKEYLNNVNDINGDFLNKKIKLPQDSKVICNPPYSKISKQKTTWPKSEIVKNTKELYAAFMEKIINESEHSVIITPFSFLGAGKYYSLRKLLNNHNGFIVSFDNVPGNIFKGKKKGIFNSNNANSVRAAITVVEDKHDVKGFQISPLIRFKASEREQLLNNHILEKFINSNYQIVDENNNAYYKCFNDLQPVYDSWKSNSNQRLKDLLTKEKNEFMICMPTTCRYYTVASHRNLNRSGKRVLYAKDKNSFNFVYCFLNSSFCYWYWRLYDGGINYPVNLLLENPVFLSLFNEKDLKELDSITKNMINDESNYLVYKLNAGKPQENIKFPKSYINQIDHLFLKNLKVKESPLIFNEIHSNSAFNTELGEE